MTSPDIEAIAASYRTAEPFPHFLFDEALDAGELREAVTAIRSVPAAAWRQSDHADQVNKRWIQDPEFLPSPAKEILLAGNDPEFLQRLEILTGIQGLIADPTFEGGGVHEVLPGGHLEIHADFNIHPTTGLHRRLNVLLYLNEDWQDDWAPLELWATDMSRCVKKIPAIFNRLVCFSTTDKAFHGHPEPLACPPGRSRLAFALYYYTKDRPEEEKAPFHWALWQKRSRP